MSFVYFNSWMSDSFESAWTNTWNCVHASGWSGLAAGLNNCLSSVAPPPPLQCSLCVNPELWSRTGFQPTRDLCVLIWRSCCHGSSTCRALGAGHAGPWGNQGTLVWDSDPSSGVLSQVIHSDDHALYLFIFLLMEWLFLCCMKT